MYENWQEYQNAVALFFHNQGCKAEVNKKVIGARGPHYIDVYVPFTNYGQPCIWIIECKLWKTRVPREKVVALQQIVSNIGADKGIIFSEKGFQSGAREATRNSNVILVESLEEFERTAKIMLGSMQYLKKLATENGSFLYEFPNEDRPDHLVKYGDKVFVGNWRKGNISIIDIKSKVIESVISLDTYQVMVSETGSKENRSYPPGEMAVADNKIFVGQVFSDFILVIDIATKAVVHRLFVPGGEGSITSSVDGRYIYFASNKENFFFIIDSTTYKYEKIPYPTGGRGSMCIFAHPQKSYLYIGVQRGGTLNGWSYPGGNSFLALYDLENKKYVKSIYLAEIKNGVSDDSIPKSIIYDGNRYIYVGMFQSNKGIYKIDEETLDIIENIEFKPNQYNKSFTWVDPLSLTFYKNYIISLNRNNRELVLIDRNSNKILKSIYIGEASNGPKDLIIHENEAIVSYPEKHGLIFIDLSNE